MINGVIFIKRQGYTLKKYQFTKKMLIFKYVLCFFLFIGASKTHANNQTYLIQLTKCALNSFKFKEDKEMKVLTAPPLSLVCVDNQQTSTTCQVMEKEGTSSKNIGSREYKEHFRFGDHVELRTSQDYNILYINLRSKIATLVDISSDGSTENKTLFCSGTIKLPNEIKEIMSPKKEYIQPKNKPIQQDSVPFLIGE